MCDCVQKMNEALEPMNGRLAIALGFSPDMSKMTSRLIVATEKIDKSKRKPAPTAVASFCPFCGVKLQTE